MAQKVFQGDLYHVNSYAFDLRWLNFEMTKNFDHVIYFRDGSHSQNNSIFEISSFAEFLTEKVSQLLNKSRDRNFESFKVKPSQASLLEKLFELSQNTSCKVSADGYRPHPPTQL